MDSKTLFGSTRLHAFGMLKHMSLVLALAGQTQKFHNALNGLLTFSNMLETLIVYFHSFPFGMIGEKLYWVLKLNLFILKAEKIFEDSFHFPFRY